jgi:hypothetical protein
MCEQLFGFLILIKRQPPLYNTAKAACRLLPLGLLLLEYHLLV